MESRVDALFLCIKKYNPFLTDQGTANAQPFRTCEKGHQAAASAALMAFFAKAKGFHAAALLTSGLHPLSA
jgi:hypothetical protein